MRILFHADSKTKLSRDAAETREFANNGGDINPV
jgi:hypothetical protein